MARINITKKTGTTESLNLLSAFKVENNTYVIFDSEKTSSMGLPIIYVSKLTDHLEKIIDDNEWSSVKNYLKGIINGTNFEYITIPDNLPSDEAYYKELSLPSIDSFNAIKNRYIPSPVVEQTPIPTIAEEPKVQEEIPVTPEITPNVAPTTPIIPEEPVSPPVREEPIEPITNQNESINIPENKPTFDFSNDKETFLKACENMFDALISKYQKELTALQAKEQELKEKEKLIAEKMQDATEHLANAEAKEQVANIVHDNAQKVMDLNNFMPTNPVNETN